MHRIALVELPVDTSNILIIQGDEAQHALRVKRVRDGEPVELLDGKGGIAQGNVVLPATHEGKNAKAKASSGDRLSIRLVSIEYRPPTVPSVHVYSAVPKGGRLDDMIDQISQAGAAKWCPLLSQYSVVDPREHKLDRLLRISQESAKQAGRAWTMQIGEKTTLERLFLDQHLSKPLPQIIVGDASGEPWKPSRIKSQQLTLLIGPEGGFSPVEMDTIRSRGWDLARFGPHTMRIETAAVVGVGALLG